MPGPENLHAAFEGLRSGARGWRVGNPRAVTTIVLGCILVTTVTMLALWPDRAPEKRRAITASNVSAPAKSEPKSAAPNDDVKVIGAAPETDKPCEEQTWPYIDRRCLTLAEDKPKPAEMPSAEARKPDPADQQPVGSVTAIAPTPPVSAMAQGTVGAAPAPAAGATAATNPLPSQQQSAGLQQSADPSTPSQAAAVTPSASEKAAAPAPVLSQREQRRLARERRRAAPPPIGPAEAATDGMASREANDSAERRSSDHASKPQLAVATDQPDVQPKPSEAAPAVSRHEQRRQAREQRQFEAPKKQRAASDPNRIVRRWTEYTYAEPQGQSRRVIVIQRGSARDDFFRTIR